MHWNSPTRTRVRAHARAHTRTQFANKYLTDRHCYVCTDMSFQCNDNHRCVCVNTHWSRKVAVVATLLLLRWMCLPFWKWQDRRGRRLWLVIITMFSVSETIDSTSEQLFSDRVLHVFSYLPYPYVLWSSTRVHIISIQFNIIKLHCVFHHYRACYSFPGVLRARGHNLPLPRSPDVPIINHM